MDQTQRSSRHNRSSRRPLNAILLLWLCSWLKKKVFFFPPPVLAEFVFFHSCLFLNDVCMCHFTYFRCHKSHELVLVCLPCDGTDVSQRKSCAVSARVPNQSTKHERAPAFTEGDPCYARRSSPRMSSINATGKSGNLTDVFNTSTSFKVLRELALILIAPILNRLHLLGVM